MGLKESKVACFSVKQTKQAFHYSSAKAEVKICEAELRWSSKKFWWADELLGVCREDDWQRDINKYLFISALMYIGMQRWSQSLWKYSDSIAHSSMEFGSSSGSHDERLLRPLLRGKQETPVRSHSSVWENEARLICDNLKYHPKLSQHSGLGPRSAWRLRPACELWFLTERKFQALGCIWIQLN